MACRSGYDDAALTIERLYDDKTMASTIYLRSHDCRLRVDLAGDLRLNMHLQLPQRLDDFQRRQAAAADIRANDHASHDERD